MARKCSFLLRIEHLPWQLAPPTTIAGCVLSSHAHFAEPYFMAGQVGGRTLPITKPRGFRNVIQSLIRHFFGVTHHLWRLKRKFVPSDQLDS